MKAFASALLLAGAHATAGAIDFAIDATATMVTGSTPYAFTKIYGADKTDTNILVHNTSKVSWKLATDHANLQFSLIAEMIVSVEGALVASKTMVESYQCWKDYEVSDSSKAGLFGLKCHVFNMSATATSG